MDVVTVKFLLVAKVNHKMLLKQIIALKTSKRILNGPEPRVTQKVEREQMTQT